jgi:hypothetical protein
MSVAPPPTHRTMLALMTVAVLLAAGSNSVQAKATGGRWPPQKYRFTGWMSAGGFAPHHAFVEGDTVLLAFQDAANDRPTPYKVCWSRLDGTNRKCWNRIARSFRISTVETGGPLLRLGSYVSRWYVDGHVVASWPFLFDYER